MKNTITLIKNKTLLIEEIKSYTKVLFGSLILAFGYSVFIIPHNIVPGGIIGLSIVFNELSTISVGLISLTINIPLLIWGTKVLGKKAGLKTAFSMFLVSFFIDLISFYIGKSIYITDILVSTIFGGILIGLSVFIVMEAGATTGGNDILVRIISKKTHLPFNQLILIIDAIIVVLGTVVFRDFTMAAYCIIAIVAISKSIEYFIKKTIQTKTILIFSTKNELIQTALYANEQLSNGIVKLTNQNIDDKMILITKSKKMVLLENLIQAIDSNAHITILESNTSLK